MLEVDTFTDLPDIPGDAVCDADPDTPGLQITLRAAVMFANEQPGPDEIVLPEGVFKLTLAGLGDASIGDLDVTDDLLIRGVAADPEAGSAGTVVDAAKAKDRVFDVQGEAQLELVGLTLRKGRVTGTQANGGLIRVASSLVLDRVVLRNGRAEGAGGALHVASTAQALVARDVLFFKNLAGEDGGGLSLEGGVATLERATFQRNTSKDEGGALRVDAALANLINCTLSGNSAKVEGGAIRISGAGVLSAVNCTLAGNAGKGTTGISVQFDGASGSSALLRNTLLDNKGKRNGDGPVASLGGNLDSGTSCGFGGIDQSDVKPLLLKLKHQGGFTPTHALKTGSPAIDTGIDPGCPPADQRGELRVDVPAVGWLALCDCGAFEFVPATEP